VGIRILRDQQKVKVKKIGVLSASFYQITPGQKSFA